MKLVKVYEKRDRLLVLSVDFSFQIFQLNKVEPVFTDASVERSVIGAGFGGTLWLFDSFCVDIR